MNIFYRSVKNRKLRFEGGHVISFCFVSPICIKGNFFVKL